MRRPIFTLVTLLVLASAMLSACAPAATSTPQVVIQTSAPVQQTVVVTGAPVQQTVVVTQVVPATPAPTAVPGSVQINGSGATFPLPIYTQWTYAYQYVDPSVAINYQGVGSGAGKKAIIDGTVDFAGSDALVTDAEYASGKDLQMFPAVAGAVVVIYNVPTLAATDPKIILDGKTLVGIYNATIKNWNDPAIAALNPGIKDLPAKPITVVHRSDGSGTTEIFTRALSSFSPDWTAGGAQTVQWPVDKAGNGIGGKGNPGVAAAVQTTPNSLGYVELDYAVPNGIPFTQLVNKAGTTVTANAESLASAMADFSTTFTDKLTNIIVDGPGAKSWPISGYTYYVLHMTSMKDCTKAQKLLQYITWTLTDPTAAKQASQLGYAVLPDAVRTQVLAKLATVTCNGQPVPTK
jgi:phosphate transport system substrate-binding protein